MELELVDSPKSRNDWKPRAIAMWTNNPYMTNIQVAEELGCTERTVQRWRRDPEFVKELVGATRSMLFSMTPQLYAVSVKKALDGDWKFMKILLDHIEKIEQHQLELVRENTYVIQWKNSNMITIGPVGEQDNDE